MDKLERHITIADRSSSHTVAFTGETDSAIRKWLRDTVFGGGSTPVSVHARNGQVASAMPFKEGLGGFRRLKADGLVDRIGQNYHQSRGHPGGFGDSSEGVGLLGIGYPLLVAPSRECLQATVQLASK